ncbi:hypothetical protein [Vibrio vulnificus YJ016]|uniref:Uncharacterized protein n=1 Tax=Vibrio vulnificus (strain YJ016) TaxID=196600 RepID=Q7MC33_VIBVY|nr:hypothetical protein [Vibrio vulnificus YJ016]
MAMAGVNLDSLAEAYVVLEPQIEKPKLRSLSTWAFALELRRSL